MLTAASTGGAARDAGEPHDRVRRGRRHVTDAGPPTLIPPFVQELGVKVAYRLEDAIRDVDVIMMLRLQHERMMAAGLIPAGAGRLSYWLAQALKRSLAAAWCSTQKSSL